MKAIKWLDEHFEETILAALLVLIACIELMQVVCRNVPFIPALTWAEELCRFLWIATVFMSLPYTIRKANMLRVTVLLDALPHTLRGALNIAVDVLNGAAMALLAWASAGVLQGIIASGETSPAMLMPMWIMYAIVLLGFSLAVLRAVQQLVLHVMHFGDRPLSASEQAAASAAEELEAAGFEARAAQEGGER